MSWRYGILRDLYAMDIRGNLPVLSNFLNHRSFQIPSSFKRSQNQKCQGPLNILKVLANTHWGADRTSLLRLYRALIRSKLDYGSVVYSSACKSLLKILIQCIIKP
ncbi:putative RNA-directed DNA polymerase from transposon X-element [Trichonephila clavipes]|nr:putative RNA-directed DNA polymerase from transposon X-element [Trichonephila clavipes]